MATISRRLHCRHQNPVTSIKTQSPQEHTSTGLAMLKQQSHIVAPIPDELRTRALYTVNELRERGKADKEAIDKLYSLIIDLTENGLDFFFLEPLRRLKAGNMLMSMAKMGINSMFKGSKMVIHKVLKKLDDRSLASILDFIEEIIHEPEAPAQ
jgi:hypothetical protein